MKLSEYLPDCVALTNDGSSQLYERYWNLLDEALGSKELDEIKPGDIRMVAKTARRRALARRNHQGGVYAEEHLIAAARRLFQLAMDNDECASNPAAKVDKPSARSRPATR